MKIIVSKNHEESSLKLALMMVEIIKDKPNATLGLATGGSAEHLYKEIVTLHEEGKVSFKDVHTVNLDEYVGLAGTHDQSYRYFMNKHLFDKVDIDKANTYVPIGDNADSEASLRDFQNKLANTQRDFQLLGIGINGHVAFNEPASALHSDAHIVTIAESTVEANSRYFASKDDVPKKAFSQGIGNILKAKKIALIATGDNKAEALKNLLADDMITTDNPSTFLKAHNDVTIFIDENIANLIGYKY